MGASKRTWAEQCGPDLNAIPMPNRGPPASRWSARAARAARPLDGEGNAPSRPPGIWPPDARGRLRPGDGRRPAASVGRSDGAASDGPEWGARHRGRMPGAMFPKLRSGARPARTVRSAGACRWRLKAVLGAIELRARTELAKRQRGSWDKREHERRKGCENRCRWAGAAACDPRGAWRACARATYCRRLPARAGVKPCLATSHGR